MLAPRRARDANRPEPATHTVGAVADAPIGIFDSGYGGLTVARAVLDQLPHERVVYLGDTARQPYGPRPIAQVRQFSLECMDLIVDRGVKALVIACNSASAAVLHDARERYDVPVVEVIRPAVRRAVACTRSGRVGVISTLATHRSHAYLDAFAAAPHISLTSRPCPRFVDFVEAGTTAGPELLQVAREYLEPLTTGRADAGVAGAPGVDTLILGCTHYPLLTAVLAYVMGEGVTLVSSAEETAQDLYRILADSAALRPDHLAPPAHEWHTTGDPAEFARLARRFLGPEVALATAAPVTGPVTSPVPAR